MLLLPTAARSCRQPSSGIELNLKSTDFSALLTTNILAIAWAPVGPILASEPYPFKSMSVRVVLLSRAVLIAMVPSSPISFPPNFALFNALLNSRSKLNRTASGAFKLPWRKLTSIWPSLMPQSVFMLPFCFAAATMAAAPSPRSFLSKLTEVNVLLNNRLIESNDKKCN